MACLATDVTEKKLVWAGVDCTVAFEAAMLEGGCCVCLFGVGKACLSNVFVADLKLGAHELNEAHFVNEEDIGFLKNLNIHNSLPRKGREATLQWDVAECSVNCVERREA